jgi:ABC-type branched-subunit amino acid transport system ATPase component
MGKYLKRETPHGSCRAAFSPFSVTELEIRDQRAVLLQIGLLNVVEQASALADHLQETLARVVILVVRAEVVDEMVDPGGEQRHLNPGRATVTLVQLVLLDNGFAIDRHVKCASSRV